MQLQEKLKFSMLHTSWHSSIEYYVVLDILGGWVSVHSKALKYLPFPQLVLDI